jgi:hypothetical protein
MAIKAIATEHVATARETYERTAGPFPLAQGVPYQTTRQSPSRTGLGRSIFALLIDDHDRPGCIHIKSLRQKWRLNDVKYVKQDNDRKGYADKPQ